MNDQDLLNEVKAKAQAWTQAPHDEDTQRTVRTWLDTCDQDDDAREALIDAFYTDLSFGTGGLRGKMGPGTNRINATTIALATQGLANHLLKMHGAPTSEQPLRVAIACDSRHQSQEFAQITAEVLAASGLEPWLYPELRPTPQLSWTVRELGAVAGVVVTASHNPSIYNGYKVYAADGGQVVAPEDAQLVAEVRALSTDQPVARTSRRHSRAGRHMGRPLPRRVGLVPVVARFGGERVGFDHRVHRLARHRCTRRACGLEGLWIQKRP